MGTGHIQQIQSRWAAARTAPGAVGVRRRTARAWGGFERWEPEPVPPLIESLSRAPVEEDAACRLLNIFVASAGIVLLSPLFLLIAAAVKLSSPGPIIFAQPRVGLDRRQTGPASLNQRRSVNLGGRIFTIYKFRTMRVEAPQDTGEVWASPLDPRITPLGRVLRRFRLDELPQLFNVLKGDMNVVGPRPEQPQIFQELRQRFPSYPVRQRVLPGITGWAQINRGYDQELQDVPRKVYLDVEYIRTRSAPRDLAIMVQTLPVMILGRGAV